MIKNPELRNKLLNHIERKQAEADETDGNPWDALKRGDLETACKIFAKIPDWKNCLDTAQRKSP